MRNLVTDIILHFLKFVDIILYFENAIRYLGIIWMGTGNLRKRKNQISDPGIVLVSADKSR